MSAADVDVVVVGAGLAGLAAAHRLRGRGRSVAVFERSGRTGGAILTERTADGFLFERGPTAMRTGSVHLSSLIHQVGLASKILPSLPTARARWVWKDGGAHRLPMSPGALLKSHLLSARGKARLLLEPFIPARPRQDESLASFVARRFGAEAVEALADPFVTGIFAGRAEDLGLDAFPFLRDAEREHGSLVRALLARGGRGGGAGLMSLEDGLSSLTDALGDALGDDLRLSSPVARIEAEPSFVRIHFGSGDAVTARRVIVATTARPAAAILGPEAAALEGIPSPPVVTVGLGVRESDLTHPLDGFGLLRAGDASIPSAGPVIGLVFASNVFTGRAPEGHRAVTAILGGSRHPEIADLDGAAAVRAATWALDAAFGLQGDPVTTLVTRWPRGIPQLLPGHARRVAGVRAALPQRVHLAGAYLDTVGLEGAARSGLAAADALFT